MQLELASPALLFPAVSLLMLAYTNRFLALANLIRNLHARYQSNRDPLVRSQIVNLRWRMALIRNMQSMGVLALLACVICMFLLFAGYELAAKVLFGASMTLMMFSLGLSLWEIQISGNALDLQLRDLEQAEAADEPRP